MCIVFPFLRRKLEINQQVIYLYILEAAQCLVEDDGGRRGTTAAKLVMVLMLMITMMTIVKGDRMEIVTKTGLSYLPLDADAQCC